MKRVIIVLLSATAVLIIAIWATVRYFPDKLVPFFIDQQLELVANNEEAFYEKDGMVVVTVGTATPLPGERAQTGTAVFVNGHFFLFDVGAGVVQKSENLGLPLTRLNGIFLTHYHSDHMMDLPNIISRSWVLGRTNDLHIYGPDSLDFACECSKRFSAD